jgi:hypothetical protein
VFVKKVRLNLKRGVKSWSFVLYDSVESAFYLQDEPILEDEDEEYRKVVTLRPGEFIEAEWIGAEWVYDDENDEISKRVMRMSRQKYDKVRVGKLTPLKNETKKTGYLEVYSGWVIGGQLPWVPQDDQSQVRITPIIGKIRSRFDFSKIFSEAHLDEEDRVEEEPTPKVPSDFN